MMPKALNELYKRLLKQRQDYISIAFVGLDFSPTLVSINIYIDFLEQLLTSVLIFRTKINIFQKENHSVCLFL